MAVDTPAGPGPAAIGRRRRRPLEQVFILLLAAAAVVSILVTVGIVFTLVEEGVPFFTDGDVSLWDFLTGTTWQPVNDLFGVWPLLAASLYIAAIAAVVAIPLGLGSAIYLGVRPERVRRSVKPVLELAGMPTIVLGFFALDSIIPALQDLGIVAETQLFSALAGIVVGVLITPLISSLSEDAMRAVPNAMREGAYGVGATRRHVATRIVFPAALSGITAGIVLGLSGPSARRWPSRSRPAPSRTSPGTRPSRCRRSPPTSSRSPRASATRGSVEYQSIFAVGLLLFVVTLIINLVAVRFVRRFRTVYQ